MSDTYIHDNYNTNEWRIPLLEQLFVECKDMAFAIVMGPIRELYTTSDRFFEIMEALGWDGQPSDEDESEVTDNEG